MDYETEQELVNVIQIIKDAILALDDRLTDLEQAFLRQHPTVRLGKRP